MEKYLEAIRHYEKAHDKAMEHYLLTKAYILRGHAKVSHKRYSEAKEDYNAAIALDPKHVRAFILRAEVNMLLHQYDEALDDFNTVLDLLSKHHDAKMLRKKVI